MVQTDRGHDGVGAWRGSLSAACGMAVLTALALCGCEQQPGQGADQPAQQGRAPEGATGDTTLPAGHPRGAEANEGLAAKMSFPSSGEAVLSIVRRGPESVRAGEEYEYMLAITNQSEHTLHHVVIRDYLGMPAQPAREEQDRDQQAQQGQPSPQQGQPNPQQGQPNPPGQQDQPSPQGQQDQPDQGGMGNTWTLPMLGPGETQTVRGTLPASGEGTRSICTTATYEQAACTELQVVAPALRLEAAVIDANGQAVGQLYACDEAYLRYRVTNPGGVATAPVRVTHSLPEGVAMSGGAAGEAGQERQLQFQLDPIPPGESVERKMRLQLAGSGPLGGTITAEAGDLTARARLQDVLVLRPELRLELDAPSRSFMGRPVIYRVTVLNPSPALARDAFVRLTVPPGAQNVDISSQEVREQDGKYELGTIAPGGARTFVLRFDPNQTGTLSVAATAEAYCARAVQQQVETEVVGVPAVRLEVIDLNDPVAVGDTVTYEVQVKNQGSAEDLGIRLAAQLPEQLEFQTGAGDTRIQGQGQKVTFQPIDRLAPGEVLSWHIEARAVRAGRAKLGLQLTSKANPQPVIEQEPTTIIEGGGQ